MNTKTMSRMSVSTLRVFALLLALGCSLAAFAQSTPASLAGKWQLSWEARIGTEHGSMQLQQVESKLSGSYKGHISSSNLTGTVQGNKVTLNIDFPGAHPFTLVFTGTLDGDKIAGKFAIPGFDNGYDSHGENATPSNYSWTAVRQPAEIQAADNQEQSDRKIK